MMHLRSYVLVLSLAACAGGDAPPAEAPSVPQADTATLSAESVRIGGFTLATAAEAPWREDIAAPAHVALDPAATEPIGSIVEGRVTRVYVMPGDRVARGQVLVSIHSHELMDARAELGRARAGVQAAESRQRVATAAAARAERLFGIKALAAADLERARGDREEADAGVDAARAELARADALVEHLVGHDALPADYDEHWVLIRAPMAGQVMDRHVEPGNVVLVGAPLVTVSRTSTLVLVAHLPEGTAGRVRTGSLLSFTTPATGTTTFAARVTRVYPAVDSLTRTVEVHAAITDPRATQLRAEMFATAQLSGGTGGAALAVPTHALQVIDGDTTVIAVQPRGEGLFLQAVPVRTGRLARDRVEILSGLQAGQQVVDGGAAVARAELLKRRGGGGGEGH